MDLALLFTMQHLAANEQKTAFIGVRLPEFRASQKGLHEYVMSGMDPMLGHVMSDLYVSRWASVVKGLAGYWIDGPSRNSAALVRLDNPVYGKGLFHRLMFLGKLEWLMVHYGFSAYPPETLDSNGLNV